MSETEIYELFNEYSNANLIILLTLFASVGMNLFCYIGIKRQIQLRKNGLLQDRLPQYSEIS
jgi:hypothetical protein